MPNTAKCLRASAGFWLAAALVGCSTVRPSPDKPLLPTQFQTRSGPYCVFTSTPMPADAPAIRNLQALEKQVETTLGLRVPDTAEPIEVYILDGPEAFQHFLMFYFPELPTRRAFFLAQGNRRVVYTYQGNRLDEDLRHEATHALLHAAASELPLWLDEGLAEYFEVEPGRDGLNAEHMARLPDDVASGWVPDLKRLEAMKDVRRMTPRDYRESWAWVHFLLNGSPSGKAVLLAYLADLRSGGDVASLSQRLESSIDGPGPRMLAHVEKVREASLAASRTPRESTVRFQDSPPPKRRRGFFGRIAGVFGF
jgi:hypothetical protein